MPRVAMEVRRVRAEEHEALGEITVRAYRALFDGAELGPYEEELREVGRRARDSEVYVALYPTGVLLGGVTLVPGPGRLMSEFTDPEAAGLRMLAVDPRHQGVGVGRRLVKECVGRARELGRRRVVLHSTAAMTTAHRLYYDLGFARAPSLDRSVDERPDDPDSALHLMAFSLEL